MNQINNDALNQSNDASSLPDRKSTIRLSVILRSLDPTSLDAFVDEIATAIDLFLTMSRHHVRTGNDAVDGFIQLLKGKYGYCDETWSGYACLNKVMAKYIGDIRWTDHHAMLRWVARTAIGNDSRQVIHDSIDLSRECRSRHIVRDLPGLSL